MKRVLSALLLALSLPIGVIAHDGHGSLAILGTVKNATATAIEVEWLAPGASQPRIVKVSIDSDTKYKVGKQRVTSPTLVPGSRVVISADYETESDGTIKYKATDVRISEEKKKSMAR